MTSPILLSVFSWFSTISCVYLLTGDFAVASLAGAAVLTGLLSLITGRAS